MIRLKNMSNYIISIATKIQKLYQEKDFQIFSKLQDVAQKIIYK